VIDGLEADVVTLALAADVIKLQHAGLIEQGCEKELLNDSIISHFTVALLTRPSNPREIKCLSDLTRPGVSVVTANPKISGGARWNFLWLWGAITQAGGSVQQAKVFVRKV
jgi:sulfate transport system substrate-binding protein